MGRSGMQQSMRLAAWVQGLVLVGVATTTWAAVPHTTSRSLTKVAEGVYLIIHKDVSDDWPEGNTIVIVGDRGVFVVDACLLVQTAKEDIAEIRKLTPKPVRYLLNTHWHIDHNAGNSAYLEAFPDAEIVAQSETRRIMNGKNPGVAANWAAADGPLAKEIARLKGQLASGKGDDGKPLAAEALSDLPARIAGRERQFASYKTFRYQPPTLVFDRELTIDLGREIQVRNLGRAATGGDAFVYLPQDKILITGDLLVWPLPYTGGSFPLAWKQTLSTLSTFDAGVIVPGHGPVLKDKPYLNEVIALLDSVTTQVAERVARMRNIPLDQFKPELLQVDVERFRKSMAGDDPERNEWFKEMVGSSLVERWPGRKRPAAASFEQGGALARGSSKNGVVSVPVEFRAKSRWTKTRRSLQGARPPGSWQQSWLPGACSD